MTPRRLVPKKLVSILTELESYGRSGMRMVSLDVRFGEPLTHIYLSSTGDGASTVIEKQTRRLLLRPKRLRRNISTCARQMLSDVLSTDLGVSWMPIGMV